MEHCLAWGTMGKTYQYGIAARICAAVARGAEILCMAGSRALSTQQEEINRRAEYLLDTYGSSILRYAYSYLHNMSDAEEILQDTLLQFLKSAPQLDSPAHEKAWLLRVAGNLSKNLLRYHAVRATDELREELMAVEREDLSFVWDAVKSLPEHYREVIHLYYCEGYTTAMIASMLGKKESTVRSDLHRGRARLKEILKEDYDFAESV